MRNFRFKYEFGFSKTLFYVTKINDINQFRNNENFIFKRLTYNIIV